MSSRFRRYARVRAHTNKLFLLLGSIVIVGVSFFILHTSSAQDSSHIDESQYAEVGTTTEDNSISSTTPTTIVPIVVYHIVRPAYPDDSESVKGLAQTPELFDAQMQYLSDAGYHVISFGALEKYLKEGETLPKKPIVISFDDGWTNQILYALPILEKHHFTATFFIFTDPIGKRGFLTWDNLRTIRDAGMSIGSHTLSHPFLTTITNEDILWKEITESKKKLERHLGIVVREFAYPFGFYNPEVVALVKKAGYTSARGDRKSSEQSVEQLYTLGALNAPVTLHEFKKAFPAQ
jgi:peptidoglycan/xylan/chitin deacetylase (PgdA/CDA1 family)